MVDDIKQDVWKRRVKGETGLLMFTGRGVIKRVYMCIIFTLYFVIFIVLIQLLAAKLNKPILFSLLLLLLLLFFIFFYTPGSKDPRG